MGSARDNSAVTWPFSWPHCLSFVTAKDSIALRLFNLFVYFLESYSDVWAKEEVGNKSVGIFLSSPKDEKLFQTFCWETQI